MSILTGREYHIYRRFDKDDGIGLRLNDKPLDGGLWCALQTLHRAAIDPDNYAKDSYLKLVSFAPEGQEVLVAAIVLEKVDIRRTYFLQWTNKRSKKVTDLGPCDSGLCMAMMTMHRRQQERQLVLSKGNGHFSLTFYQGERLINKVMLQLRG